MTQTYDLTGNTLTADGFTGTITGAVTGAITTTSPLTLDTITFTSGAGAPSASATKGSMYFNTTGSSSSTRLYVNNGTTNWVAITTAS